MAEESKPDKLFWKDPDVPSYAQKPRKLNEFAFDSQGKPLLKQDEMLVTQRIMD